MRRKIVVCNWKLNKTVLGAQALARELCRVLTGARNSVEVTVAPPLVALYPVAEVLKGSGVSLTAQNCYWESSGSYTGEVTAPMLAELGCQYVILGHVERRRHFAETDATVNKRLHAALEAGLTPMLCVGETLEERASGQTLNSIERQLSGGLAGISPAQAKSLIVAYEPMWAIGTGYHASCIQVHEVQQQIRGWLAEWFLAETSKRIRLLYGGGVIPELAREYLWLPEGDGVLVGTASLNAGATAAIVEAAMRPA